MKKDKKDGDIVVEEPKGSHKYGHIQIYNAKHDQWVSDFKQRSKDAMVHSTDIGERHYYRYSSELTFPIKEAKKEKLKSVNLIRREYFPNYKKTRTFDNFDYYNDNSSSYDSRDRVSVDGSFIPSRDGGIGYKVNVSIPIPCTIF